MEEIKQSMNMVNLEQKSSTCNYKLIIPIEVEKKIRFTCQEVWNTEWSGILFFTYKGSFETNDLTITCKDIYVMDIGSTVYTTFNMNADVVAYMTENPELLDCQIGLLHSHHSMETTFSGVDINTLKIEGKDRNNFVSLIVNNKGTYTAAITRNVKSKQIEKTVSYEFFGEGEKQNTEKYTDNTDNVEWFYLKIEKEGESYCFKDIKERLEEVKKNKSLKAQESTHKNTCNPILTNTLNPVNKKEENKVVQPTLFADMDGYPFYDRYNELYGQESFNKDTIKSLVLQLLTGSIIISNTSKIDIAKWVKSMPTVYEKRFGKDKDGMDNFKMWAESYIEYLTWNTTDKDLKELGFDETDICSICAHDMIEELDKLPKNDYIRYYIKELQKYIML